MTMRRRAVLGAILVGVLLLVTRTLLEDSRPRGEAEKPIAMDEIEHVHEQAPTILPRLGAGEAQGRAELSNPVQTTQAVEHIENMDAVDSTPEGPEHWEKLYAEATLGQIIDESRALHQLLNEQTEEYYERAWALGNYSTAQAEKTEKGGYRLPRAVLGGPDLTNSRLDASTGEVRWVTLPHDQFEEQYRLKQRIEWLMEREQELRRQPLPSRPR